MKSISSSTTLAATNALLIGDYVILVIIISQKRLIHVTLTILTSAVRVPFISHKYLMCLFIDYSVRLEEERLQCFSGAANVVYMSNCRRDAAKI